jgi:hypothetical protein
MKIKKVPIEYKRGDLVRHKSFVYSNDIGELGIVVGTEKREHPYLISQKEMFEWVKVYMVVSKTILTLPATSLCKVGQSGGEWYEVGFGDTEVDYYSNPEMLCIE